MLKKPVVLLALVALLSLGALAGAGATSADAKKPDGEAFVVLKTRDLHAASRLRPSQTNLLASRGGSVQTSTRIYISSWGTEWTGGFTSKGVTSAAARTYVEGFFGNVGGSNWINTDNQYCQGVPSGTTNCASYSTAVYITNAGGQFAGSWADTTTVPANPTQSDIAAAADRLRLQFGQGADANATYMVFTPSGKSMSGFGTQWCAWHSSASTAAGRIAYAYIPFMPDAGASCGAGFVNAGNYLDGFSIVAGHEYEEAKSDPFPNGGWLDRNGAENADKCAWNSLSNNISLGGNNYAVQPLWSNKKPGCVIGSP